MTGPGGSSQATGLACRRGGAFATRFDASQAPAGPPH